MDRAAGGNRRTWSSASDPRPRSYVNGVQTYFQDLTAASGTHNNSNAVSTQYNDAAGPALIGAAAYSETSTYRRMPRSSSSSSE